ncbi:MAG: hypothetical protein RSB22_14045, partial [Acinetobacter sp.]
MTEFKCKIKTLLEKNDMGLNDQFIGYISTDENLGQLSKLLQALRLNPKSGLGIEISQPETKPNLAEEKATAPLKLTESEAVETVIMEPAIQSNDLPVNTAESRSNLFSIQKEIAKVPSAVVRLEDQLKTE